MRRFLVAARKKAFFLASIALTGAAIAQAGCVTVRPEQRSVLADPIMQFENDPHAEAQLRHAVDNRRRPPPAGQGSQAADAAATRTPGARADLFAEAGGASCGACSRPGGRCARSSLAPWPRRKSRGDRAVFSRAARLGPGRVLASLAPRGERVLASLAPRGEGERVLASLAPRGERVLASLAPRGEGERVLASLAPRGERVLASLAPRGEGERVLASLAPRGERVLASLAPRGGARARFACTERRGRARARFACTERRARARFACTERRGIGLGCWWRFVLRWLVGLFGRQALAQTVTVDTSHTIFYEAPTGSHMFVYTPGVDLAAQPTQWLGVNAGYEADIVSGASIAVKAGPAYQATHPGGGCCYGC